jgi:hypothetical protein
MRSPQLTRQFTSGELHADELNVRRALNLAQGVALE